MTFSDYIIFIWGKKLGRCLFFSYIFY